jgi:hypothetical protein
MKYLFMSDVLNALSNGRIFRRIYAIALWIIAVIIALGGLAGLIGIMIIIGRIMPQVPATATFGMILFMLLFIVGIYMIVHTVWIRANQIADLPDEGYTMIPILCIFLKLTGEVLALISILTGVGMGLLTWFSGGFIRFFREMLGPFSYYPLGTYIGYYNGGTQVVSGLIQIIAGLIAGFFQLAFFYLLSEMTLILVDIAVNIHVLRQSGVRMEAVYRSSAAVSSQSQTSKSGPSRIYCPSCGVEMAPGIRFCENCGAKMPDIHAE